RPSVASFASESPTASGAALAVTLLALAVLPALARLGRAREAALTAATFVTTATSGLPPDQQRALSQLLQQHLAPPPPAAAMLELVRVPFAFAVSVGILFGCAKLLGGRGTYLQLAYASALNHDTTDRPARCCPV